MSFVDFRFAPALLTALSVSACRSTPAADWTVIESAANLPAGVTELTAAQCAAACREEPDVKCHLVELDLAEKGAVRHATKETSKERAIACDYHRPGSTYINILPTPFGRVPVAAAGTVSLARVATERDYFVAVAQLEAASVAAFRALQRDLSALGAPARFLRAAGRAARDEATHATLALELARRFGAVPSARQRAGRRLGAKRGRRRASASELALENAVAGCVAESFGVWLHAFQARAAADPAVRAFARRIAREESYHAAFAFQLFDWLAKVIGASEQALVERALRDQWQRVPEVLRFEKGIRERLGLPSQAEARSFTSLLPPPQQSL